MGRKRHARNIFENVGHELGNFFGTNKENRGQGTLQHITGDIGKGLSEVLHTPERLIKTAGESASKVVTSIGSSGSQVLDSAGKDIKQLGTGVGGILQQSTLPLLIGGGLLLGFSFLRR